jgi:hypothetical protein
MDNDAKFYSEDPYVIQLQKELEISEKKRKEIEIENANLKRIQSNSGKELLLEDVVKAARMTK